MNVGERGTTTTSTTTTSEPSSSRIINNAREKCSNWPDATSGRPGQKVNGISSERVGGMEEKRERDTLFPRPARI